MLYADAQKTALAAAKEIVVAYAGNTQINGTSTQDVADFYETIYRRALALALEVKP